MTIRIIHIITPKEHVTRIVEQIQSAEVIDSWNVLDSAKENIIFSILITLEKSQLFLDALQQHIGENKIKTIFISTVETVLPQKLIEPHLKPTKFKIIDESERVPREELYSQVDSDTTLNGNYLFLTVLSTIVAALGLLQNHIPAIIAAMVIAPMLEPILAMALSVVLGDSKLFVKSVKTNIVGIVLCLALSILIGYFWPYKLTNVDLLVERTNVGYSSIVLALASGAAAALSLTSRLSAALVGVMVAVALLPPLVATGLLFGSGFYTLSIWAGILFSINIVCVNLSANLVFLSQGIHPRKWYEKKQAKKSIFWYLIFWLISLFILFIAIYFHQNRI